MADTYDGHAGYQRDNSAIRQGEIFYVIPAEVLTLAAESPEPAGDILTVSARAQEAAQHVLQSNTWRQSEDEDEDEDGGDYSCCSCCGHQSSDVDGYLTYELEDELFDICPICVSSGRWSVAEFDDTDFLLEPLRAYVTAAYQWHSVAASEPAAAPAPAPAGYMNQHQHRHQLVIYRVMQIFGRNASEDGARAARH